MFFKQDIGIRMGIDLAPFWANFFIYFFEFTYKNNSFHMDLLNHINIIGFPGSKITLALKTMTLSF